MPSPLVSIVIPSYKPVFFREALSSALAQDYRPVEILVSDNCPTEAIADICADLPRVHYVRHSRVGHYVNFDHCLKLAQGELIKFLLDDDVLKPNCLGEMIGAYLSCPASDRPSLIASKYERIEEDGTTFELRGFKVRHARTLIPGGVGQREILMHANNAIGPLTCVMIQRAAMDKLGPDYFVRRGNTGARGLIDVALYVDLGYLGPLLYLTDPLVKIRRNRFQLSQPENNPNAVLTISANEFLSREAAARGLLSQKDFYFALGSIAKKFRLYVGIFPDLAAAADRLDAEVRAEREPEASA